jgi:hypothetical protein
VSTRSDGVRTATVNLYLTLVAHATMEVAGAAGAIVIEGPFDLLFAEVLQRLTGLDALAEDWPSA